MYPQMNRPIAIVVTSINEPNRALRSFADGLTGADQLIVIGDKKSPADFVLPGCRFYSVEEQLDSDLSYAVVAPLNHYARKNIGYLMAIREGYEVIVDTDDDNLPRETFFSPREQIQNVRLCHDLGWVNIYKYFSDAQIWPRGFPLDHVQQPLIPIDELPVANKCCPIQQGLADENPDVDAIYRLLFPLPQSFRRGPGVGLSGRSWCPFNSQNTTWFKDAFPLLYLPAYCSFRMTDIWRSLVAQRVSSAYGWGILFHEATVWQERNEHNLMRDFEDEVPGYVQNRAIMETLVSLKLDPSPESICLNLSTCYESLVAGGFLDPLELDLLGNWLNDLQVVTTGR